MKHREPDTMQDLIAARVPNEGQVEAFVTWYAGRLRAHAGPAPTMAE